MFESLWWFGWRVVLTLFSFFGDQEGPFELGIVSISAVRNEKQIHPHEEDGEEVFDEKLVA
jgi:hypothetical protein